MVFYELTPWAVYAYPPVRFSLDLVRAHFSWLPAVTAHYCALRLSRTSHSEPPKLVLPSSSRFVLRNFAFIFEDYLNYILVKMFLKPWPPNPQVGLQMSSKNWLSLLSPLLLSEWQWPEHHGCCLQVLGIYNKELTRTCIRHERRGFIESKRSERKMPSTGCQWPVRKWQVLVFSFLRLWKGL